MKKQREKKKETKKTKPSMHTNSKCEKSSFMFTKVNTILFSNNSIKMMEVLVVYPFVFDCFFILMLCYIIKILIVMFNFSLIVCVTIVSFDFICDIVSKVLKTNTYPYVMSQTFVIEK